MKEKYKVYAVVDKKTKELLTAVDSESIAHSFTWIYKNTKVVPATLTIDK